MTLRDKKQCEKLLKSAKYYADNQAASYHGEALNAVIKVMKILLKESK